MFDLDTFATNSGRTIYSTGFYYEEDDSALGFEDFYFLDDKTLAGTICQSPSGRKHTVSVNNRTVGNYPTVIQAYSALKNAL